MLSTALTILALGGGTAQRLPDQLDVLRGADRTPQVRLLIDLSGSMLSGHQEQTDPCLWYIGNRAGSLQNPDDGNLSRIDQLLATLTGCRSSDDGIIDRWASRMVMAIDGFEGFPGSTAAPVNLPELSSWPLGGGVAYSSSRAALEAALLGVVVNPSSGTPLVPGLHESSLRFRQLTDSNSEQCRPNAIVLMTDGLGNSGLSRTFDHVTGPTPVTVRDEAGCYVPSILPAGGVTNVPSDCSADYQPPHGDVAAQYLWGELSPTGNRNDAVPNLSGTQPVRTYTIGFSVPDSDSARMLQDMADVGGGEYLDAQSYQELYDSFDRIMTFIRANAETSFRGITVQGDGLFTGNYVYQNSFQGVEDGHWFGNIKKFCLIPESNSNFDCLLEWDPAVQDYVVNDAPLDLWSNERGLATQTGGAGARLWEQMNPGMTAFDAPVPSDPYGSRNIVTWDESVSDYIAVSPSNTTFGPADTFTRDLCQHYALLNKLYGYTYDTAGCTAGTVAPVAFDFWPLADTINGGQVLLRYGDDCEQTSGGSCFLATVSNAGMLHIFDTATGNETQAVIPPQFFRPNAAANNQLSDLMNQPSLDLTRRYYFDGGLALYHDDVDGNGYINTVDGTQEPAYLVAGFGRGGAAYIKWDVSTLTGGQLSRLRNPPHPLFLDRTTGLQHLRDTWATPWVGNHQLADGRVRPVAIFPSGHQPELDAPAAPFAELGPGQAPPSGDTETSPYSVGCAELGISADVCATPSMRDVCRAIPGVPAGLCGTASQCSPCNDPSVSNCASSGFQPPFCYDWPGLAGFDPAPLARYGITSLSPLRISVGPFSYSEVIPAGTGGCGETVVTGQAYRITFSRMNLQTGDSLILYDANGVEVERFTGTYPGGVTSGWIRSPSFRLRLVTDGVNSGPGDGYAISGIDVIRDVSSNPTCNLTRPGMYVMDLEEWNGEPSGFAAIPGPGEARQATGILARFTSDCTDSTIGPDETCVDEQTSPDTRDLRYMTCPISADPAVYTEGGLVRGIYFGDECGQVWALRRSADSASWTARRLLSSNETNGAGFVIPGRASRHYRKIFSAVDLVASTCTGRRGIGVYFGTGNMQRPASIPSSPPLPTDQPRNLEEPQVTRTSGMANSFESDIMGVVWDTPDVPPGGYRLGDLSNVTTVREIDPTAGAAQAGFFQELDEDEKILRAPLVFDGVAFFQSYQPTRAATECEDAVGRSRTYAFDNCTALPVRTNSPVGFRPDRTIAENPDSFIGGGLRAVVPEPGRDTGPMILSGDARAGDRADLQSAMDDEPQGGVRLLMWRTNVR